MYCYTVTGNLQVIPRLKYFFCDEISLCRLTWILYGSLIGLTIGGVQVPVSRDIDNNAAMYN